jgi:hypothetical protein
LARTKYYEGTKNLWRFCAPLRLFDLVEEIEVKKIVYTLLVNLMLSFTVSQFFFFIWVPLVIPGGYIKKNQEIIIMKLKKNMVE